MKICVMEGVQGGDDLPVELHYNQEEDRLEVVTFVEGGCAPCAIDLIQLMRWLESNREWGDKFIELLNSLKELPADG